MVLNLPERVVRAALHSATEERLLETGVPRELIDEVLGRREILDAQAVARADTLAACRPDAGEA